MSFTCYDEHFLMFLCKDFNLWCTNHSKIPSKRFSFKKSATQKIWNIKFQPGKMWQTEKLIQFIRSIWKACDNEWIFHHTDRRSTHFHRCRVYIFRRTQSRLIVCEGNFYSRIVKARRFSKFRHFLLVNTPTQHTLHCAPSAHSFSDIFHLLATPVLCGLVTKFSSMHSAINDNNLLFSKISQINLKS